MNQFNANPDCIQDVAFLRQWIRGLQEVVHYQTETFKLLKEQKEIMKEFVQKHEDYRLMVEGKNDALQQKVFDLNSALLLNSDRGALRQN